MTKIRMKFIFWYSKVLAAAMAMLGFVTCTKETEDMYGVPVMYGSLPADSVGVDTAAIDTNMRAMYGIIYTKFRAVEEENSEEESYEGD
ncbi:MAG: hypothetical protein IJ693_11090 [Bacteroidaceae bacterium]|nr:hypothetical protein [Bacteroidaceae bacterium]